MKGDIIMCRNFVNISSIDLQTSIGKKNLIEIMQESIQKLYKQELFQIKNKLEYLGYFYSANTNTNYKNKEELFDVIMEKFLVYYDSMKENKECNITRYIKESLFESISEWETYEKESK